MSIFFEHLPLFFLSLSHFSYITNPIIFLKIIETTIFLNDNYLSEMVQGKNDILIFPLYMSLVACMIVCFQSELFPNYVYANNIWSLFSIVCIF